jgi:hypothetical protein
MQGLPHFWGREHEWDTHREGTLDGKLGRGSHLQHWYLRLPEILARLVPASFAVAASSEKCSTVPTIVPFGKRNGRLRGSQPAAKMRIAYGYGITTVAWFE